MWDLNPILVAVEQTFSCMIMPRFFNMYIGLCSYSTTDSERKQQCVTLDENDLGSVKKWQAYQLHETWPSLIGQLLSFEHFKGLF